MTGWFFLPCPCSKPRTPLTSWTWPPLRFSMGGAQPIGSFWTWPWDYQPRWPDYQPRWPWSHKESDSPSDSSEEIWPNVSALCVPGTMEVLRQFQTRDVVYVPWHSSQSLESQWKVPFTVLLTILTIIKVESCSLNTCLPCKASYLLSPSWSYFLEQSL